MRASLGVKASSLFTKAFAIPVFTLSLLCFLSVHMTFVCVYDSPTYSRVSFTGDEFSRRVGSAAGGGGTLSVIDPYLLLSSVR